jgi:RNA-directed DNA polymerase
MPLQSDSPPASSPDLVTLRADEPWVAAVEAFRCRNPRRRDRLAEYEALLAGGTHRRIGAAVLERRHRPEPPEERWINKLDGRKKRVFRYPAADELLFRTLNHLLQPAAAVAASPWCRSFLPGGGARTAFRAVLTDGQIGDRAVLRLDVRDYFNSVDVHHLLETLPTPFTGGPVRALLDASLLDRRVVRDGHVVDGGPKGLMAGTPLAPLLATLYLRDLDHEVASSATYARYSDDILVAAPPEELPELERLVRARLAERRLSVNEEKSAVSAPGEPWDFLGFRHHDGSIGLAPVTERKFKARANRLGRALLRWRERTGAAPDRAVRAYLRRTNRRLYGVPGERADFSWATWFLPLLDAPEPLSDLDEHLRRECRYAATGRRTASARRAVPHDVLVAAGHLPLVSAYWALRDGVAAYEALVRRRT